MFMSCGNTEAVTKGKGLKIEKCEEFISWKVSHGYLKAIINTELGNLTKLVECYTGSIINRKQIQFLQNIDNEGTFTKIHMDKEYFQNNTLSYSEFVSNLCEPYPKIEDFMTNKIVRVGKDIEKYCKSKAEEVPLRENRSNGISSVELYREYNNLKYIDIHSKTKKIKLSEVCLKTKFLKSIAACSNLDTHQIKRVHYRNEEKSKRKGSGYCDDQWKDKENITKPYIGVKPPNILVFADNEIATKNIKTALSSIVNKDKYAIYDLPTDANQTLWNKSTVLVVVCGTVPLNLIAQLIKYFLSGGQLLCLCSNLTHKFLNISIVKITEHQLIQLTYGKWKQVNLMHQGVFSKSKDPSDQSVENRCPSIVKFIHNGKSHILQVDVLGTEETWRTPCLLRVIAKDGNGSAVLSQVHLEIDPNQYPYDKNKLAALKDSDAKRLEIWTDILMNHLDIDCSLPEVEYDYSPAYLLGQSDVKTKLLTECKDIKDNKYETEKLILKFCCDTENTYDTSSNFLPVLIHSSPSNFSILDYFENLKTKYIGRLVIYSDVITSTQYVLSKKLEHGLAVITRQQTQGQGRANNIWITPIGCAPCSLQLHVPLDSSLGKKLPLVQHIATLAIVSAIREHGGCKDLDIGIKWPNDIYVYGTIKIGGILINSFIIDTMVIIAIGFGVNLSNANPTLCINEIIRRSNETKGTNIETISFELFFALVFNEFEKLFNIIQDGDIEYFYELYYNYWLHNSNNEVSVANENGIPEKGKIIGIDNFGFLRIVREDGSLRTVHPDGNRFDMLSGLIYPKT